jgi:hypothetical protein
MGLGPSGLCTQRFLLAHCAMAPPNGPNSTPYLYPTRYIFARQINRRYLPHDIWPELYQLEKDLDFWITGKSFSNQELAARFHERIETIHPFANGNSRFGRVITEQICRFHQYEIPTWGRKFQSNPAKRRTEYISALTIARRQGTYLPLISLMFS